MGNMDPRKAGAGDAIGKGRWSGGRPFEKSAQLLVESPVKINQFTREYLRKGRVEVEEIHSKDVAECLQFLKIWCEQHDCDADPESDLG